jgi:hypothetical protein
MTTQDEVLQAVAQYGSYSARLYKFNRPGIRVKGTHDVSPAEKLTEKGILKLTEKREEPIEGGVITHFTWVRREIVFPK